MLASPLRSPPGPARQPTPDGASSDRVSASQGYDSNPTGLAVELGLDSGGDASTRVAEERPLFAPIAVFLGPFSLRVFRSRWRAGLRGALRQTWVSAPAWDLLLYARYNNRRLEGAREPCALSLSGGVIERRAAVAHLCGKGGRMGEHDAGRRRTRVASRGGFPPSPCPFCGGFQRSGGAFAPASRPPPTRLKDWVRCGPDLPPAKPG